MNKIKAERIETRLEGGKVLRVTVVERQLTPEEQREQRMAALEVRVAALEARS